MQIGIQLDGQLLTLSAEILRRHVYVIGEGKSTFLVHAALAHLEHGLLLIDRHGFAAQALADRIPEDLTKRVIYWEPARYPIGFNPLKDTETVTKALIAALTPVPKKSKNFYDEMEETILRTLVRLIMDRGKGLKDIKKCLLDPKNTRRLGFDDWTEKQRVEYTTGLVNKLSHLDTPTMQATFSSDTLDLEKVVREKYILILDLAGTTDMDSRIIGGLALATLQGQFHVFVDDCELFINEHTPEALRHSQLTMFLGHQYETQLLPAMLDALMGLCATVISFRLGADVKRIGARLDLPEPNELRRLDDGEAIVATVIRNSPVFRKVKTLPLPEPLGRLEPIRKRTRATYGR